MKFYNFQSAARLRVDLRWFAAMVLAVFALPMFGQYAESYSATTESKVILPFGSNVAAWDASDKVDVRPWNSQSQTAITVGANCEYQIILTFQNDSRFAGSDETPSKVILNSNGLQLFDQTQRPVVNLPWSSPLVSQFQDLANGLDPTLIGRFPSFQPLSPAQIREYEQQGFTVTVASDGTSTLTSGSLEIIIVPYDLKITIRHLTENRISREEETFFQVITGTPVPRKKTETDFLTLTTGECIKRVTTTRYADYQISGSVACGSGSTR